MLESVADEGATHYDTAPLVDSKGETKPKKPTCLGFRPKKLVVLVFM